MLFKDYQKDDICKACGKRLEDLATGAASCQPCQREMLSDIAKRNAWQHFLSGLYYLFSFDFFGAFGAFILTVQRLFKKGKYGETGQFTQILKRETDAP